MSSHKYSHDHKVRLTVECSFDERTYIKMLAAKKHVTISELLLAPLRSSLPPDMTHEPNAETIEALKESREKKLVSYETVDDFWKAMGIDPNA
ncbi:MAG: hypothetical protein ACXU9U_04890 [Parachlamydiaceae bacterium]